MAISFVICAAIASGLTIGLLVRCRLDSYHHHRLLNLCVSSLMHVYIHTPPPPPYMYHLQSIDTLELEIKQRVGTEDEKWQAQRILPVLHRRHLLLVVRLGLGASSYMIQKGRLTKQILLHPTILSTQ